MDISIGTDAYMAVIVHSFVFTVELRFSAQYQVFSGNYSFSSLLSPDLPRDDHPVSVSSSCSSFSWYVLMSLSKILSQCLLILWLHSGSFCLDKSIVTTKAKPVTNYSHIWLILKLFFQLISLWMKVKMLYKMLITMIQSEAIKCLVFSDQLKWKDI